MKQNKMKMLRKLFLYLAIFVFASFVILSFAVKWDTEKCIFILGLGFIFLGVSYVFKTKVFESEGHRIRLELRQVMLVSLIGGLILIIVSVT